MISRELYEEIVYIDYSTINRDEYEIYQYEDLVIYRNKFTLYEHQEVNIYELAHKCKEWADKQNIGIKSYIWFGIGKVILGSIDDADTKYSGVEFREDTEPEAIFKACEWILQQKEKSCDQNNK